MRDGVARDARADVPRTASAISPRSWDTVLAFAFGVVLSALVLEGILRLFPEFALSPSTIHELRWQAAHRRSDGAPDDGPERFSPALGWEPKPSFRSRRVTTNSRGLRGAREYSPQALPGIQRVLCVGDSFTFGDRLADDETMPVQLEAALNAARPGGWEVLNLGVNAYGTDQQYLRLRRVGLSYHPDIVVLGFFEEDVRRNVLTFRDYAKPYFDIDHGRLRLRNVPVPAPDVVLAQRLSPPRSYVVSFFQSFPEHVDEASELPLPWPVDISGTRTGRVTLAILDAMRDMVGRHHARFLVVVIPRRVTGWPTGNENMLAHWAERTRTPALVLREAYLDLPVAERDGLYDGHWTAKGARVSAQLLADELRDATPRGSSG